MGLDIFHIYPTRKNSEDAYLQNFAVDELNPEFIQRNDQFLTEEEDEDLGRIKRLYFQKKGYQRNGMDRKFFRDFENDKPYYDKATLLKAYEYLQGDHIHSLGELQLHFKKNFIDSFVEGESIFFASW